MGAIAYRRLRAPERHGEALVDPAAAHAPALVAANRHALTTLDFSCGGRSFAELRRELRREILAAAGEYVRAYAPHRNPPSPVSDAPLLVAGHQPQLFHAGVWFKNFLLDQLAQSTGGVALNLIIDNDAARDASIRVPAGTLERPHLETVAYDRPLPEAPWEDRPLLDAELFASFGARVCTAVRGVVNDPLIADLWPACVQSAARHGNLGRALAEGRHALEMQWGLATWELPLSRLCETEAFRRFTVHVLERLPEFAAAYNAGLMEYRAVHGIRNGAHPAPNLAEREGRLEAPFWTWQRTAAVRKGMMVEWSPTEVTLASDEPLTLPLGTTERNDRGVQRLAEASAAGLRLRPRALLTTLFTRLFLADLFVHGIGGAKYDQVTDQLMQSFFRAPAPAFLTATATVRLPEANTRGGAEELQRVDHALRSLTYHPEMYLAADAPLSRQAQKAREQKHFWLAQTPPRGQRGARQRGIVAANRVLESYVAEQRSRLILERSQLEQQLPSQRILNSREHSFCVFPAAFLRGLLLAISRSTR